METEWQGVVEPNQTMPKPPRRNPTKSLWGGLFSPWITMLASAPVPAELLRGIERFLKRRVRTVPSSVTIRRARMNPAAVVAKRASRKMNARLIAGYVPVHIDMVRRHTLPL